MDRNDWHRLFGLLLTDFFSGSPFVVELEKDLSLKQQFLDVVVLRKGEGQFSGPLPDGLDNLATHNLISFKSHQEALDTWALQELIGHYVNYRKQVSPSFKKLLPENDFRLYAICSRFPRDLPFMTPLRDGVFQHGIGSNMIRILVLAQLPADENNAVLHLLSAQPDKIRFGVDHYRQRSSETSTLLDRLIQAYQIEGVPMPYTMEDFRREYIRDGFLEMTSEARQKLVENLKPEERQKLVENLKPEERQLLVENLKPEERQLLVEKLTIQERLGGLSPEEIESYLESRRRKGPL